MWSFFLVLSMDYNTENIYANALELKTRHQKTIQYLRKKKPKDLDLKAQEFHDEAFEDIDCLKCANCCKTTSPVFTAKDIDRIAKSLKMKPGKFVEEYLNIDEDNDYVLKSSPCPFLLADNYCMIYEDRPAACAGYPHTQRKNLYKRLQLSLKNAEICPAVQRIISNLEKHYR